MKRISLADRLSRFGYNAIRIHHYEGDLVRGQGVSTKLNPEKIGQLDYLLAAFIRRGIYITTDLFVSRPVPYAELGIDKPGNVPMDTFKILVPVHPRAFENWKAFATSLLTHTNTFTGRRYADEPALAWLAMINEGNFGNFYKDIQTIPEWKSAWNQWLVKHYPTRAAMEAVWAGELAADELPAQGSVKLPGSLNEKGLRTRDCVLFLAETERNMVSRMKAFLHDATWLSGAHQQFQFVDAIYHRPGNTDGLRLRGRSFLCGPSAMGRRSVAVAQQMSEQQSAPGWRPWRTEHHFYAVV